MKRRKIDLAKAAAVGALLGLGAPVGYFLVSFLWLNPGHLHLTACVLTVWKKEFPLLLYLTFPTVTVFSLFGLYHGWQEARLAVKTHQMEHFLAVASHDIRNPLTVIHQAADLLDSETKGILSQAQRSLLNMMNHQVGVVVNLVEGLLDLYRMESGAYTLCLERTPLTPLVEKGTKEMELLVNQKSGSVKIVSDFRSDESVFVDVFKFRQVIRNLLDNAIRHMPEKGTILIRLLKNPKEELEVTVQNEGKSIPEERLPFIFNKFAQAKLHDQRLGYGLGLSICKDIVMLHRGRIWAENIKPSGVCFHVCLPQRKRESGRRG